jgi:uncharacterized lipoprotein YbaY
MPNAGRSRAAALAGLLLGSVAGCAGTPPASEILTIRGSLTYRARIALPPDSESVVELRDAAIPDGPVIAEQRTQLAGAQVPVPFELTVTRARLVDGSTYVLMGAIVTGGRASWVSEPVMIDPVRPVVDLGLVVLEPYTALAFVTGWTCGGESVSLGYAGDQAILLVGGDSIPVQPVPSASGVRYDGVNDPGTFIWSKGNRALLEFRGRAYPECTHVATPRP